MKKTNMDWKKMGFDSEEVYLKFLDDKWEKLKAKILNNKELLNVFIRLKDR